MVYCQTLSGMQFSIFILKFINYIRHPKSKMCEADVELKEMDKTTPALQIIDLVDDCLKEIVRFLSFDDILKFRTIPRFNAAIAANVASLDVNITDNNVVQAKGFLKKFEESVKKIDIDIGSRQNEAKELLTNYCNAGNVSHCKFSFDFELNQNVVDANLNLFNSLQSLELNGCLNRIPTDLLFRILDAMTKIERLKLIDISVPGNGFQFLAALQSHELKSLHFHFPKNLSDGEVMHLPRFDSVERLYIILEYEKTFFPALFPNVEDLTIEWKYLPKSTELLTDLTMPLKALQLKCSSESIT